MQPYFYIIQEITTGKYYAGSKFSKTKGREADPSLLLKEGGYLTSSSKIRNKIASDGINSFVVRKIRIFNTTEAAYDYETRFLRRVNAAKNPKFYNTHNNSKITPGTKEFEDKMLEKYGVSHNTQDPTLNERRKAGFKKYGVDNPSQLESVKEKKRIASREKYGTDNVSQAPIVIDTIKATMNERYGANNIMQTVDGKQKVQQSMLQKYGVDNIYKDPAFIEKNRSRVTKRQNRPIVCIIRQYQAKYKLTIGKGWSNKSEQYLEQLLETLRKEYG